MLANSEFSRECYHEVRNELVQCFSMIMKLKKTGRTYAMK